MLNKAFYKLDFGRHGRLIKCKLFVKKGKTNYNICKNDLNSITTLMSNFRWYIFYKLLWSRTLKKNQKQMEKDVHVFFQGSEKKLFLVENYISRDNNMYQH